MSLLPKLTKFQIFIKRGIIFEESIFDRTY